MGGRQASPLAPQQQAEKMWAAAATQVRAVKAQGVNPMFLRVLSGSLTAGRTDVGSSGQPGASRDGLGGMAE